MNKRQNGFIIYLVTFVAFLLIGCSANQTENNQEYKVLMESTNPHPISIADNSNHFSAKEVKQQTQKIDGIYDIAVVEGDKETLVVYKVRQMKRFKMDSIEKQVNSKLKSKFPKGNFVVSSDYKIFLEAVRLIDKMKDPSFSKKDAMKKLDKIIKLKKELT